MSKVLGIDLGTNSIGWCLLDDSEENGKIFDLGVRVFEAGVQDINTKNEQSRNTERREKRQARRQLLRKKQRKLKLLKTLFDLGFIQNLNPKEFSFLNPYDLRAKAINEKVSLLELARIFYHLIQRRGFKSSRKQDIDEKEKGAIFEGKGDIIGINKVREEMQKGNFRTLGEYFATLNKENRKIRARYIDRKMYEDEFDLIWKTQKQFYPDLLNDRNYHIIRNENLFYQRPLKSQKSKIGKCTFEPKKTRAYKSSIEFQEFRMLQQVNQLLISSKNRITDEEQKLSEDERKRLLDYLYNNDELKFEKDGSFKKLKKILGIPADEKIRVNLVNLGKLDGMKTLNHIREVFANKFSKYENKIHIIWNTLNFAEDDDWLINYAKNKFDLTEEQAKKFAKIKLEKGYANLSLKAIRKILPYLRQGYLYHEACKLAGYKHTIDYEPDEKFDLIPKIEKIPNPVVYTSLVQLRKVINELILKYGKPEIIRIELVRDLKLSRDKRLELLKRNKDNEAKNLEIKEKLMNGIDGIKIPNPTREDILKYRLWEECHFMCPYTGKSISAYQLFGPSPVFQIEHILPYSRTLDDSYNNKTLCYVEENINKGNRTPYEYYYHNKEKFEKIKERVKKNLPDAKAKRFFVADLDKFYKIDEKSDFIERQLNDTRYASKLAKNILKTICDDVTVTKGEVTGKLRYLWGLNSLLKPADAQYSISDDTEETKSEDTKIRTDHRHHAIDAAVIALTNRSILQRLSTMHAKYGTVKKEMIELKQKFPIPWKNFREDLKNAIQTIIVSHKIKRKPQGKLHDETFYSKLYNPDGSERLSENGTPLFAVRKKLIDITPQEVLSIIDPVVKKTVIDFLLNKGLDPAQLKKFPRNAFDQTIYMPCKDPNKKIPINKVRIAVASNTMIQLRKDYNVWVEPSSNHHMIIYSDEKGKIHYETVSLLEAARRKAQKQPVINKNLPPNCEFIVSLQRNEMFILGSIPEKFDPENKVTYPLVFEQVYRIQKMDKNGNIVFRKHFVTATSDTDSTGIKRLNYNSIFREKFTKIIVTPAGFIKYV